MSCDLTTASVTALATPPFRFIVGQPVRSCALPGNAARVVRDSRLCQEAPGLCPLTQAFPLAEAERRDAVSERGVPLARGQGGL